MKGTERILAEVLFLLGKCQLTFNFDGTSLVIIYVHYIWYMYIHGIFVSSPNLQLVFFGELSHTFLRSLRIWDKSPYFLLFLYRRELTYIVNVWFPSCPARLFLSYISFLFFPIVYHKSMQSLNRWCDSIFPNYYIDVLQLKSLLSLVAVSVFVQHFLVVFLSLFSFYYFNVCPFISIISNIGNCFPILYGFSFNFFTYHWIFFHLFTSDFTVLIILA